MKKVWLIAAGALMLAQNSLAQFEYIDEATIIKSKDDAPKLEWFKYSKKDSIVYMWGGSSEMTTYAKEFLEWAGTNYNEPEKVKEKKKEETRSYLIEYDDGQVMLVLFFYRKDADYAEMSSCIFNRPSP